MADVQEKYAEYQQLGLHIKQLQKNPWQEFALEHPVGSRVEGTVTSIADFGVFVEVQKGIEGLVFASEVARDAGNLRDLVKEGQTVEALVVRVEPAEQKIALSMRAIEEREEREALDRNASQSRTQTATLGDRMPRELLERMGRKTPDDD